uniref:Solute carrier family 25 member 48 n=1 Tax=Petromyzon marinus TaxID=7757 RepID=S4RJ68_PETMA
RDQALAFFKGMSFPLASIAAYNSLVFGVFSTSRRVLESLRPPVGSGVPGSHQHAADAAPTRTPVSELMLASALTGAVSVTVGAPVDLVKIRLQMQTQNLGIAPMMSSLRSMPLPPAPPAPRALHVAPLGLQPCSLYRGPIHCVWLTVSRGGLRGLYRGAGAMLLRDVPGYCTYFVPYVLLCQLFTPSGQPEPSMGAIWVAGGLAGSLSWGLATPFDVVKSRLQADGVVETKYTGAWHCAQHSYRAEGLGVFFRGLTVNLVRGFPMSAAAFLAYEFSLRAIRGMGQ